MTGHVRPLVALVGAAGLLLGACAADGSGTASPTPSPTSSSAGVVPTAEQLASLLVTEGDYAGEWTVNVPPDVEAGWSGVVTDEQAAMLPSVEFCDRASEASVAAAEALRWQAFRQLDMTEQDPIDFGAGDRSGHMVFVQEFLLAADPSQVESMFTALRDGMDACLGESTVEGEGPATTEVMTIPEVGDDRYAQLLTMGEAGGSAEWRLHTALVRAGSALVMLNVVDIVAGKGVQPQFTSDDIDTFITTAAAKLP